MKGFFMLKISGSKTIIQKIILLCKEDIAFFKSKKSICQKLNSLVNYFLLLLF
ncbi:hypothetical protein C8C84_1670 [Flavobacterium sp. 102]|nr:hypothetical protein C8C84_1670 [Flavobacterium sp. 102]